MLGKIYAPFLKKTSSLFLVWNKVGKIYKSQKPRRGKFIIRLNYCHPCLALAMIKYYFYVQWKREMSPHVFRDMRFSERERYRGPQKVHYITGGSWRKKLISIFIFVSYRNPSDGECLCSNISFKRSGSYWIQRRTEFRKTFWAVW